jgi:hypothetical protein
MKWWESSASESRMLGDVEFWNEVLGDRTNDWGITALWNKKRGIEEFEKGVLGGMLQEC